MTNLSCLIAQRIRFLAALITIVSLGGLTGCANQPPAPSNESFALDEAVMRVTDDLILQTHRLPAFLSKIGGKLNRKALVIDPVVDATTGQQSMVMGAIEQQIVERIRAQHAEWEVLAFTPESMNRTQYIMAGTLSRAIASDVKSPLRLTLALIELTSGKVAAQSAVLVKEQGLDANPTPYYRDSPVLVRDAATDAYTRAVNTPPGRAVEQAYLERAVTAALTSEAVKAYNEARYDDALALYTRAAASPGGEQLRIFTGLYLANWKLGREAESERAFGRVVALGLVNNNLGVKFLFRPGSTDFWPDPKVSGPYALWLRQIARQVAASKRCLNLVGHSSHTGPEEVNNRLSLQRAAYVKQRLDTEADELAKRTKAFGLGWRENLVGSGTDDARDALDRRVEFKITEC